MGHTVPCVFVLPGGGGGGGDGRGEEGFDGVGEFLVGGVEEEGEVPLVGVGQDVGVGGHAGAADAVVGDPEELAGGFGGGRFAVAAEELLGVGEHGAAEGGLVAGVAVALRALGAVDAGGGFETVLRGGKGRLLCLVCHAAVHGNRSGEVFPEGGFVGDGNGWVAEVEPGDGGDRDESHAGEEAVEEFRGAGGGA